MRRNERCVYWLRRFLLRFCSRANKLKRAHWFWTCESQSRNKNKNNKFKMSRLECRREDGTSKQFEFNADDSAGRKNSNDWNLGCSKDEGDGKWNPDEARVNGSGNDRPEKDARLDWQMDDGIMETALHQTSWSHNHNGRQNTIFHHKNSSPENG